MLKPVQHDRGKRHENFFKTLYVRSHTTLWTFEKSGEARWAFKEAGPQAQMHNYALHQIQNRRAKTAHLKIDLNKLFLRPTPPFSHKRNSLTSQKRLFN